MNIFRYIREQTFARNIAVLTIGAGLAQVISFISIPLLSRMFTPEDYGLLAIYSAIVITCATVFSLRYEYKILSPKNDVEAQSLVFLVAFLAVLFGTVTTLISSILPASILYSTKLDLLGRWLTIGVVSGVITAIAAGMTNWFNRCSQYKIITGFRLTTAICVAVAGLTFGFFEIKSGLLFAQLFGAVFGLIYLLYFGVPVIKNRPRLGDLKIIGLKYRNAPKYLLPTAVMNVVTMQLPFFLIAFLFSAQMTGHYRMAYQLLAVPGSLIGMAVSQVFFQRMSDIWPDAARARTLLINSWIFLFLIGSVPLLIVLFFGPDLFALVLGEEWREAGIIATYIAPMVFFSFIHSPTSTSFIVMGEEKLYLLFGLAIIIYRPLALYIGYLLGSLYSALLLFVCFECLQIAIFQLLAIYRLNNKLLEKPGNYL